MKEINQTPLAVILDMDGLMLNTEHLSVEAWQCAAHQQGVTMPLELCVDLMGRTEQDCDDMLSAHFENRVCVAQLRSDWRSAYIRFISENKVKTMPGLAVLLDFLRGSKIPHIVATSSRYEMAKAKLTSVGLGYLLDPIVTAEMVERGKPAPDAFLAAARLLNVPPSGCVVLEDSEAGVQAGLSAGMTVFMIPSLKKPIATGESGNVRVVDDLETVLRQLNHSVQYHVW